MTSHTLGIFKKIFEEEGPGLLACQLHTGTTFFNYTTPGDATVKTSNNNLYAKDGSQGFTNFSQRWDDGTRNLVTNFIGTRKWPAPPEGEPTLKISVDNANQIIKNKSYIGQSFETFENRPISPAHIATWQEIDDTDPENPFLVPTDYIIWYRLRYSGTTVIFEQHKILYDPNIDQESITAAPQTNVETFSTSGTDWAWPYTVDPLGYNEKIHHLPQQGRTLTCNKAGTKTLFFLEKKNALGEFGTDYQIFELTDIPDPNPLAPIPVGDKFEINQHSVYVADNINESIAATKSVTGEKATVVTYTLDKSDCPDSAVPYTFASNMSGSGTVDNTAGYNKIRRSTFLGVAFDRYDDSVSILDYYEHEDDNWPEHTDYSQTADSSQNFQFPNTPDNGLTQSEKTNDSHTVRTKVINYSALRINGVNIVKAENWASADSHLTGARNYIIPETNTCNETVSINRSYEDISSYNTVDLASRIFVYKKTERHVIATVSGENLSVEDHAVPAITYDRIYCYANGKYTIMKESADSSTQEYVTGNNYGLTGIGGEVCEGYCQSPLPIDCFSTQDTYVSTTTEQYTRTDGGEVCFG